MSIPESAVKLINPPISQLGGECDIDGDIDQFGRVVVYQEKQWYAWYPHPNEPLF